MRLRIRADGGFWRLWAKERPAPASWPVCCPSLAQESLGTCGCSVRLGWSMCARTAQRRVYSLRPEPLAEVDNWLARYRSLWEQRFDALHTEVARGQKDSMGTSVTFYPFRCGPATPSWGSLRARTARASFASKIGSSTDIDDLWSALTDPHRLARRGIAPCGSRHGTLDNKAGSPWLEGQSAVYVKSQLQAFASGARRNDISQQMRNIVRQMMPEEMEEAANYYASQPPNLQRAAMP